MGKTGVITYSALLLAITATRAVPLFNSTLGTDLRGSNENIIGVLAEKTAEGAVTFCNDTATRCSAGPHSIVGVIQNTTTNVTKHLLGGRTATNWTRGSLAANRTSGDAGNSSFPRSAQFPPGNVSTTNVTSAPWKNGTRSFNVSTASGSNSTRTIEFNATLQNHTTGERMVNDEGVPQIDETADSNSSVCPPLVGREGWSGKKPLAVQKMKTPVPFVVIHHTYIPSACNTSEDCEAKMRSMQDFHMGKGWLDIGYNFIVGGDNRIYTGRGWDVVGAHSPTYNFKSIGISFIGDYRTELPSQEMMELAWSLIHCGVARGSIDETYKLVGHRQVRDTECPGDRLYQEIQTWPHWVAHRDIIPRTNTSTTS